VADVVIGGQKVEQKTVMGFPIPSFGMVQAMKAKVKDKEGKTMSSPVYLGKEALEGLRLQDRIVEEQYVCKIGWIFYENQFFTLELAQYVETL
jgi:hypothetical protein